MPTSCRPSSDPTAFAATAVRRALYLPLLLTVVFAGVVLTQTLRLRSSMAEVAAVAALALVLGAVIAVYVRRDLLAVARAYAEALDAVARARDDAQEASRLKDEFLGTISHELRTPLNAIMGWTALLRRRPDDPHTRARAIETIDRNARAQARLVEDMLDVSRIVSGDLHLRVGPVDLGSVVESVSRSFEAAAGAKRVTIEATVSPDARTLRGDVRRVQQILWNLVANAVKFTPAGGRVRIGVHPADHGVEIRVADSGPGIGKGLAGHLFEPFRQGDGSATRSHGGVGLGLVIVRHLTVLHGGTVHVENPGEEGGATFVVVLPAGEPPPATGDHSEMASDHWSQVGAPVAR